MSDFRWLRPELVVQIGDGIAKFVAEQVEAQAVRDAPVDTGTLARSISTEQVSKGTYRVGTHVHYAPYVEFGTRRTRAQPFLGPALEQARRRYGG